ncbi:DoxX family protein [Neisseriaceae bacterium JH1-16]|nr:DoxX family protein [Neisseriaceae bacterium JH1-16]
MDRLITIVSRILLAQVFVISGFGKLGAGYAATQGYMAHMGVPGFLLPLVILLELGGGLALAVGFQTRWIALLLAGFAVVTALIFHHNIADQGQFINLMKNFAMAGGLLLLVRSSESQR